MNHEPTMQYDADGPEAYIDDTPPPAPVFIEDAIDGRGEIAGRMAGAEPTPAEAFPGLSALLLRAERLGERQGLLRAVEIVKSYMEPGKVRRDVVLALLDSVEVIGRQHASVVVTTR